jgi:hypothetical protein
VGKDLILFYSVEAIKTNEKYFFGGTFFIHGIFFAHEPEQKDFLTIGSTEEDYQKPAKPDPTQWERYPEP